MDAPGAADSRIRLWIYRIDTVGVDRVVFGMDWPYDRLLGV